jgi:hypothetical protein
LDGQGGIGIGSKATIKTAGMPKWQVVPGSGPVAQVAHPISMKWNPRVATDTLIAAAEKVPNDVVLLVTGGGYISLDYPKNWLSDADLRQPSFLATLHRWTLAEVSDVIRVIGEAPERDFVVGVDVSVNGPGPGQFALWVGRGGCALIPKRFPVGEEVKRLAGVDAPQPVPYPRIVNTRLRPTLLLVCHDAQAYNRRNRGAVLRARKSTSRGRAISELDQARATPGLKWALNVVHWIEGEPNTRTFRISYDQLRTDFTGAIHVAGGFGYGRVAVESVPGLLDRMVAPRGMTLTKVIIHR